MKKNLLIASVLLALGAQSAAGEGGKQIGPKDQAALGQIGADVRQKCMERVLAQYKILFDFPEVVVSQLIAEARDGKNPDLWRLREKDLDQEPLSREIIHKMYDEYYACVRKGGGN